MADKSKYKAIEDKGQRLVFVDHARKRLYTLDIFQYLNKNLELMRNDKADDVDYVAKATELDSIRPNIGSGWVPVVLSCKSFLMCRSDSGFHLINPATKEWKKVPKTPLTKMSFSWELYGFGFDESTSQYKVIEGKGGNDGNMERRALGLKWSLASHITGYSIVVFGQNSDLMLVDATGLVMCDFDDKHCWSFSISHNMGEVGGFGSMGVYVENLKPLIDQEQLDKSKAD
ncbi:hypothetical protein ACLB2K_000456 [Fragaria x ananassa]